MAWEIPLSRLIETHQQKSLEYGISEVFGDTYLLTHNPVYRSLRLKMISGGVGFTSQPDFPYFAMPFMMLDHMLSVRVIPFVNNSAAVEYLEEKRPEIFSIDDLTKMNVRKNYLMHESAHLWAELKLTKDMKVNSAVSDHLAVLRILLAEAFANACETYAYLFVWDPISAYFFMLNTYRNYHIRKASKVMELRSSIGERDTLISLILGFMINNLIKKSLMEDHIQIIQKILGVENVGSLYGLADLCDLESPFLNDTSPYYFKFLGLVDWEYQESSLNLYLGWALSEILNHLDLDGLLSGRCDFSDSRSVQNEL